MKQLSRNVPWIRRRPGGARYADIRLIESRRETASVKDGHVDSLGDFESLASVFACWSAMPGVSHRARISPGTKSIALPHGPSRLPGRAPWFPENPWISDYRSRVPAVTHPHRDRPLFRRDREKLGLLLDADRIILAQCRSEGLRGRVISIRHRKTFANTEGAMLEQTIFESGGAISATAVSGDEIQVRSLSRCLRLSGNRRMGVHRR